MQQMLGLTNLWTQKTFLIAAWHLLHNVTKRVAKPP